MKKLRDFSKKIGISYIAVTLIIIIIVSMISIQFRIFVGFNIFYTPEQFKQLNFFSEQNESAVVLITLSRTAPFFVGALIFIIYTIPFLFKKNYLDDKKKLLKKILNLPLFGFLSTIVGWTSGNIIDLLLKQLFLDNLVPLEPLTLFIKVSIGVLFGILMGVLIYYSIEFMNQTWLIPKYFSKGEILGIRGSFKLTLSRRFILILISSTILPLFFLNLLTVNSSAILKPTFLYSAFFLILSVLVSILQINFFKTPLEKLDSMATDINDGKYDQRARIISADEIGRLTQSFNKMSEGLKERDAIKDTFGKMVDPAIRDHLMKGNIKLGGEIYHATVLFSDIRDFTTISEQLPPEKIVELLNRYFSELTKAIMEEGGLINKFIGDAVMVLFGMPIKNNTHAQQAVRAAEKLITRRDALNIKLKEEEFPVLKTGIGIHTGQLVAGNIGSSVRMEYTAIGDTVNVASRLESSCKKIGKEIVISEQTYLELTDNHGYKKYGRLRVKGRDKPVVIYT